MLIQNVDRSAFLREQPTLLTRNKNSARLLMTALPLSVPAEPIVLLNPLKPNGNDMYHLL
jgi:hypothetical protein